MAAAAPTPLTLTELGNILRAADPAALLVPPRILRRIIKADRAAPGIALQVPHRQNYVVDRDRLLELADREELGVPAERELPETLILLRRSDPSAVETATPGDVLLRIWRQLFHGRVHLAIRQRH